MKKALILILVILVVAIFTGCKGQFKVTCDNKSSYIILVTGDENQEVDRGTTKDIFVKSGGCLNFDAINLTGQTISAYSYGRRCFNEDNRFVFYDPLSAPLP